MSDFEDWQYYIGVEGLTEEQLRKWSEDPNRLVECCFCGVKFDYTTRYCPFCKDYKGIRPYISDWSYWD